MSKKATDTPQKNRSGHKQVLMKSAPESLFSAGAIQRAAQSKKAKFDLRKQSKIPGPFKAIRNFCLECMGDSSQLVKECNLAKKCGIWPYRMGRNPTEEDLQCAQYKNGRVSHWIHYSECKGRGEK
jgi:hypothetical protein